MQNGKQLSSVSNQPTSIVHSGAAPLLQSSNPIDVHAGIGGSVLDILLPVGNDEKGNAANIINKSSWSTLAQKAGEPGSGQISSANAANAFEQFRKQAREKEERVSFNLVLKKQIISEAPIEGGRGKAP